MADQLLGTDYTQILQSKKQSRLFTDSTNVEHLTPFTFLTQILGWAITRILSIFSAFLSFLLQIEKLLINLRVDTLQLFYWGRGNVFALFAQAILVFVVISIGFTWVVGQGLTPKVVEQYIQPQSAVYASNDQPVDVAVESGSLTTLLPKGVQRIDMEDYVVTYGDTIGGNTIQNIADVWDVTADSIRWANNFASGYQPKAGTVIKIPPASGSYYTVQSGDSLEFISARFKVDQATIEETNFMAPPFTVTAGQQLFLPGVEPVKPTAVSAKKSMVITSKKTGGSFTPPNAVKFLSWPVAGRAGVFSRCYSSFHDGIDMAAGGGNPNILAAAPGRVTYAGVHCTPGMWGSPCGGYAWVVEIDHGNGYSTLYGHLLPNSIVVGVGEVVTRGQLIGKMGTTGTSTGTHLHFQLNHGGFLKKGRLIDVNPGPYMIDAKFCGG